ncbi:MAG: hypothetical protein AAGB31_15140 [Bdellovibrio sp.]
MRRSQISRTVIQSVMTVLTSLAFHAPATAQEREPAAKAPVKVYEDFQKRVSQLEADIKKEKDVSKRYEVFLKAYGELSALRAKNPRQSEEQELNMSLFMDSFAAFPDKKEFKAQKCGEYSEKAQKMKSYDEDQKEPFVDRALKLADSICR